MDTRHYKRGADIAPTILLGDTALVHRRLPVRITAQTANGTPYYGESLAWVALCNQVEDSLSGQMLGASPMSLAASDRFWQHNSPRALAMPLRRYDRGITSDWATIPDRLITGAYDYE